jgi:hypothetical protein
MAQVYMDKVLINQENPPKLENTIIMFAILDAIITIIILACMFIVLPFVLPKNGNVTVTDILYESSKDYAIALVMTIIIGSIVAQVMYNKKYFMYKDDGLRAIRAMKDILQNLTIIFSLIPFFLLSYKFPF